MNCTTVFIHFFYHQMFLTITASAIVSHYSKEKTNTIFTSFIFLTVSNACYIDNHPREMLGVQRTFIWSHTAFKRTCKTACIVRSLILKLHNLMLFFCYYFFSVATEWMRWTESWRWIIAKACFFWHLSLFWSVITSSPPKTFDGLYMKCVFLLLFIIRYHWPHAGIVLYGHFHSIHFRFPLVFTFAKTHQSHFDFIFLSKALKLLHQVQKGADCTHTNYDRRCLWALYPLFTFYLWAKRRWSHQSDSRKTQK